MKITSLFARSSVCRSVIHKIWVKINWNFRIDTCVASAALSLSSSTIILYFCHRFFFFFFSFISFYFGFCVNSFVMCFNGNSFRLDTSHVERVVISFNDDQSLLAQMITPTGAATVTKTTISDRVTGAVWPVKLCRRNSARASERDEEWNAVKTAHCSFYCSMSQIQKCTCRLLNTMNKTKRKANVRHAKTLQNASTCNSARRSSICKIKIAKMRIPFS